MAVRKQWQGKKIIEADNGFGWERKRGPGSSALSILPGLYETQIFGITYTLQKFEFPTRGWCMYALEKPSVFWGEFCAANLFPAIDKASEMIAKADLRGEGYEKKEN